MKLVVSNIAWTNEEEPSVAKLLQELGVKYIEIAPTKIWEQPTKASDDQISEYKNFWASYGIEIVAFQSMLFTRPDLKMFESEGTRIATANYLKDFIKLAGRMNSRIMVFGSPKNRQRGEMPEAEAMAIAKEFFNSLGVAAQENNLCFCIEPNATQYACDFITNAAQGLSFVKSVANPGFGLHLDTGCMALAGDNIHDSIINASSEMKHFHISSPMLEQVEARDDVDHSGAASALKEIGYDAFVSIEMKPEKSGTNETRVKNAVVFAKSTYDC